MRIDGIVRLSIAGVGNCSNFFRVVREAMEYHDQDGKKSPHHGYPGVQ
ncbi:MAG: hypothetical protein PHO83_04900 [Geobacteraceae bacterium]|nr:hypothetical protein [Geobacteraceae bacterium]